MLLGMSSAKKESVHVKVDKELYDKLENFRRISHSKFLLSRSDVYSEVLYYGQRIREIKSEVGDKEFERIWGLLNKLNLQKVDLGKII